MALRVNGEIIADADIELAARRRRAEGDVPATPDGKPDEAAFLERVRQQLVTERLFCQEAERIGITVSDADVERFRRENAAECADLPPETAAKTIRYRLALRAFMVKTVDARMTHPDEADLRRYYKDNREMFRGEDAVHARHVVKYIRSPDDEPLAYAGILNALEDIKRGTPFEAVVASHSDCTDRGGDLGWFGPGRMLPAFERVAFALKPGEISSEFHTEYGYHIVQVLGRRKGGVPPYEKCRSSVAYALMVVRRAIMLNAEAERLQAAATIETV